jgi:hypothetical protein
MTAKKDDGTFETHKGSLFFPLPNGTATLYKLTGTATEPEKVLQPRNPSL